MKLQPHQTLLFIGDSITDCGRGKPLGMRGWAGLGDGYVNFVDSILPAFYPETPVRILNTGISGNRVIDLQSRWKEDVLDHKPDWLSVMIGINDVWRQFDGRLGIDQVGLDRFEAVYRDLLEQTRADLDGLVLMTPYFLETNTLDPMRVMMGQYGAVVGKLAQEFDAVFVDTQSAFDRYLVHQPTQSLCGDRIHPNGGGHMIIARAFLEGIEFDWDGKHE